MYKIKFLNQDEYIDLKGFMMVKNNRIALFYSNVEENLSGFIIYDQNNNICMDCSDYIYRWDVLENNSDKIYYTNDPDNIQTKPFPVIDKSKSEPFLDHDMVEKEQLRSDVDYLLMIAEE